MARCVISDASPLIGLAIVDGLAWLPQLFGDVWIPPSVHAEVLPGVGARGEVEITAVMKRKSVRVWKKTIALPTVPLRDLDEGETDCIHIAHSLGDGSALILMDERAGRAVATEFGIRVAGTAAVIGLAKKRGLIDSAKARFERLHATDFRISAAVIQAVLRDAGELKTQLFGATSPRPARESTRSRDRAAATVQALSSVQTSHCPPLPAPFD